MLYHPIESSYFYYCLRLLDTGRVHFAVFRAAKLTGSSYDFVLDSEAVTGLVCVCKGGRFRRWLLWIRIDLRQLNLQRHRAFIALFYFFLLIILKLRAIAITKRAPKSFYG